MSIFFNTLLTYIFRTQNTFYKSQYYVAKKIKETIVIDMKYCSIIVHSSKNICPKWTDFKERPAISFSPVLNSKIIHTYDVNWLSCSLFCNRSKKTEVAPDPQAELDLVNSMHLLLLICIGKHGGRLSHVALQEIRVLL